MNINPGVVTSRLASTYKANLYLVCFALLYLTTTIHGQCSRLDKCKWTCTTPIAKGTIDLTSVGSETGVRWDAMDGKDGYKYSFNPCYPFDIHAKGSEACSQVVSCRQKPEQDQYWNAGMETTEKFVVSGSEVYLVYTGDSNRETRVQIICNPRNGSEDALQVIGAEAGSDNIYHMKLTTLFGCLTPTGGSSEGDGISVGTVLCIIFFTTLLVYIVCGIIFMKFHKKAEGREIIPNVQFWIVLPSYVKDGCVYTVSKVKNITRRG